MGNCGLTDTALVTLADHCQGLAPQLKELNIANNPGITITALDAFHRITSGKFLKSTKLLLLLLKQYRIKESDACDFCKKTETISHALFDCPSVCKIWTDVQHWFSRHVTSQIYLDKISILFGNDKNKKIINTLILIVKHEIYKKRCKKKRPTLKELKETIKYQMSIEIYLGTINNQIEKVLGKWAAFYDDLKKKK